MRITRSIYKAVMCISASGATIIVCVNHLLLIRVHKDSGSIKKKICGCFQIYDLGNLRCFLSIIVESDRESRTLFLDQ